MGLVLAVSSSQYLALWNDHISKNLDQAKPSLFLSKVFLRRGKRVRTRISKLTALTASSNALDPGKIKVGYVPYLNSSVKLYVMYFFV